MSVLFTLLSTFIAWFRASEYDEDRLYWLGIWITILIMSIAYLSVSTHLFGEWSVFAGTLAVLIAFAGLGLNVTIFQSHISENTPRKILISIWISIPILVIGYLYYFIRYAPLQTVTYVSGKPEIVSAPYVVNTLAIFIITLISIFSTILLQSKLWISDKKSRIDLWLSSLAVYLTIPVCLFALVNPTIIENVDSGSIAMIVGDYLLIPICIIIGICGIIRANKGKIEINPFEQFSNSQRA